MPRRCTVCASPQREELERALLRGVPKRQIAAAHGLTEAALGRHERSHLPALLVQGETARRAASADALLAETLAMQGKALDLLARAEAEGDLRCAVAALRELREIVELRARLAERMLAAEAEQPPAIVVEVRESLGRKLEELGARLASLPAVAE